MTKHTLCGIRCYTALSFCMDIQFNFDITFSYIRFTNTKACRTQRHPGGDSPAVDPERHPGQHDHQSSGKVGLKQEEEDVAPQGEVDVQSVVPAWKG